MVWVHTTDRWLYILGGGQLPVNTGDCICHYHYSYWVYACVYTCINKVDAAHYRECLRLPADGEDLSKQSKQDAGVEPSDCLHQAWIWLAYRMAYAARMWGPAKNVDSCILFRVCCSVTKHRKQNVKPSLGSTDAWLSLPWDKMSSFQLAGFPPRHFTHDTSVALPCSIEELGEFSEILVL